MPLHEYLTMVIVTFFAVCLTTIIVIFFGILIFTIRVCENTHIAVLFPAWTLFATTFAYLSNHRDHSIANQLRKAARKFQRSPNTVEDKHAEGKWLSTLNMMHRLIAIRLLTVDVDDIHDADKHFLEQVNLLPGGAPKHVARRQAICNEHLRRIKSGRPRFGHSENQLVLWVLAFCQSTLFFVVFRLVIALIALTGVADGHVPPPTEYFKSVFEALRNLLP